MTSLMISGQLRPELQELPPSVRAFLAESQRRVIEHCRRLLTAQGLTADYRDRLNRLADIAETELRWLTK